MSELTPTQFKTTCRHLRHKMMYVDVRHEARGYIDDSSDTRVFFCIKTQDALGPDNEGVCPDSCTPQRS